MTEGVVVNLLRHGEVAGRANVLRGKSDPPLTRQGLASMWRAAASFEGSMDAIASSPALRCREFSAEFAGKNGLPLRLSPGFAEMDFGDWEEMAPAEIEGFPLGHPELLAPPNGETFFAFSARVKNAFADWLSEPVGKNRLLVTHGGVMRVLLADILGIPAGNIFRISLPPAASFSASFLAGHPPCLLFLNR